jgi:hypothetical protein
MTMSTITATVRSGRIELDEPLNLPDGTKLQIALPNGWCESTNEAEPMNSEEIAERLAAMDRMQPLQMTDAELAAWEADRQARKGREKEHFFEHSEKLRGMWE